MSTYGVEFYDNSGKRYLTADDNSIVKIITNKIININTADAVHDEKIKIKYQLYEKSFKVYSYDFSNVLSNISTFDIINTGDTIFVPRKVYEDNDGIEYNADVLYYKWDKYTLKIFTDILNSKFFAGKNIDYMLFGKI